MFYESERMHCHYSHKLCTTVAAIGVCAFEEGVCDVCVMCVCDVCVCAVCISE